MDVAPQLQEEQNRQTLVKCPIYLQAKIDKMNKTVNKEENNWFKIEAWLWIALFFVLCHGFSVPQNLKQNMNHYVLYSLTTVTVVFLLTFLFESFYSSKLTDKQIDILAKVNGTLFLVLPFVWVAFTFKILKLLCLFLVFDCFMIVVMWPHAMQSIVDMKLKFSTKKQKTE